MKNIKAVIFDLDGTLLDTLKDLYLAVNTGLRKNGFEECTIEEVRQFVGNGFKKLIERSLKEQKNSPLFGKVMQDSVEYYKPHAMDNTKPYEGIPELLAELKSRGIRMAVVSNKPDIAVKDMCPMFFGDTFEKEFCIGENEAAGIAKKPAPDSVLYVLKKMGLKKEEALFVGDSEVDVLTAKNAGLKCISVSWGFKSKEFLMQNGATNIVDKPSEILEYLGGKKQIASEQLLEELDFFRIQKTIASFCKSEEAELQLLSERPLFDKELINTRKNLGREWLTYLSSTRPDALLSWPQVADLFNVLKVEGSSLLQDEIFALGLFARAVEKCRDSINSAALEMELPKLKEQISLMPLLTNAEREIFQVLDDDGQIKNLPSIRTIQAEISSIKKEIENALRKYTADASIKDSLQSNVPVLRSERQLLAVKADRRSSVEGIVHEVSATGQTLYIEPIELIKANNQLFEQEAKLNSELKKIFRELTEKLSFYREDFTAAFKTMVLLDKTHAAAQYANSVNGIFAEDLASPEDASKIFQAKHPLLGEKAVGVDINFMENKRVLIITGPNTGGKTVTLKTIALFALLNQCGFPILAQEGTRLELFSSVFADIGDEQSIDESLSTFSAHMKRMGEILEYADENSLVLLDELGSGTDPLEGSAIAMACLDRLLEKNSFVIVTTHHGVLKNYGWTNPKCVNASVEFDSQNLRPTYSLLMGIPGESHALDIALNSGLNSQVVQDAKAYISNQQADVSTLIKGLNQKHLELDTLINEEKEKEIRLREKELKLEQKDLNLRERQIELDRNEKTQASQFLKDTRSRLENLVRELREGEITREKTLKVKDFISELSSDVDSLGEKLLENEKEIAKAKEELKKEKEVFAQNGMRLTKSKENKASSNKKTKKKISNTEALLTSPSYIFTDGSKKNVEKIQLEEGMEVFAGSARRLGTLIRKEKDGTWQVQFGSMKMKVQEKLITPKPKDGELKATVVVETVKAAGEEKEKPVFELRLLGMRYEEAIRALERQLDLCALNDFKNFSVIHGKGNGILQQGVHSFLSHYPGVKNFYFAQPEDGGTGKTYVELQ